MMESALGEGACHILVCISIEQWGGVQGKIDYSGTMKLPNEGKIDVLEKEHVEGVCFPIFQVSVKDFV